MLEILKIIHFPQGLLLILHGGLQVKTYFLGNINKIRNSKLRFFQVLVSYPSNTCNPKLQDFGLPGGRGPKAF